MNEGGRESRRPVGNRGAAPASIVAAALLAVRAGPAAAQEREAEPVRDDSAFAELQRRGEEVMGVDQYTSSHAFEALPDGGRVVLVRDVEDPEGVERIRRHLREIAAEFAGGDFTDPTLLHEGEVPGTEAMRRLASRIAYEVRDLPRGGELRMRTDDPEAVAAIHAFLAFQRRDHRVGEGGAAGEGAHRGH